MPPDEPPEVVVCEVPDAGGEAEPETPPGDHGKQWAGVLGYPGGMPTPETTGPPEHTFPGQLGPG